MYNQLSLCLDLLSVCHHKDLLQPCDLPQKNPFEKMCFCPDKKEERRIARPRLRVGAKVEMLVERGAERVVSFDILPQPPSAWQDLKQSQR